MTPDSSAIAVACAANSAYALPLAVMLASLDQHLDADHSVDAYVLDDGLSREDRQRVERSVSGRIRLHWCPAPPLPEWLPTWGRMPLTTYQKLMIGEWLPSHVTRALWLDCDLLILADAARLWSLSLDGELALASQDQRVPLVSSKFGVTEHASLGLAPDSKYFNAGVMLIAIDRWRERNTAQRCLEYLALHRERVYFWDQEALNVVLAGAWRLLDPRWNWHPSLDHLSRAHEPAAQPWIAHFSGNLKPWRFRGSGDYYGLYYRYLDRTAWSGWRPAHSWRSRLVRWYETSALRRTMYPAEQWATEIVRAMTGTRRP